MTTLLKALRTGRRATHVDGFTWPEPGMWLEVEGPLVPCRNGLHVATPAQVLDWLSDELWLVEVDGETLDAGDKTVARRARLVRQLPWDEQVAREFAADCAERVLPIFERRHPGDDRPRKAIVAARAFARGDIADDELAAARAAAGDAARAATGDAAWAATGDAARAAAGDAARAALAPTVSALQGEARRFLVQLCEMS